MDEPIIPFHRGQHDRIEPLARPIADIRGIYGYAYRVVNTLEIMEAAGTIDQDMKIVGQEFQRDFDIAQHDPLRAADMGRIPMPRYKESTGSLRAEAARDRVWKKLGMVGGLGSTAGSCVWAVLGWRVSLRRWAQEHGIDPRQASRILKESLQVWADIGSTGRSRQTLARRGVKRT